MLTYICLAGGPGPTGIKEARHYGWRPIIHAFFDEPTNRVSYLVADPATKQAAVIDPVLEYDRNAGEVDTRSVESILKAAEEAGYRIVWTLETHAHADHLSGSPYIKAKTGAKIGIGEQRSSGSSGRCSTPPTSRETVAISIACSGTASGSTSASSRPRRSMRPGTRRPISPPRPEGT